MKQSEHIQLKQSAVHRIVDIIHYISNTVTRKTIYEKHTGTITISSLDAGEVIKEQRLAFDSYIHVVEGIGHITIDKIHHELNTGDGIIVPAHSAHTFNAKQQFKMLSTTIKSGYEEH